MAIYETYYSDGGHGGPHQTLDAAWDHAARYLRGCRRIQAVEIRPVHASAPIGGYNRANEGSFFCLRYQEDCLYSGPSF